MAIRWGALASSLSITLTISACGDGTDSSTGGSGDSPAGDSPAGDSPAGDAVAASSEIRSWTDVCDVLEPDSIAEQLGAKYDEGGPKFVGPDSGMWIGAYKCNALFRLESDPEQQQGFMYLNVVPSDDAEGAKSQFDEVWEEDYAQHSNDPADVEKIIATNDNVAGDWDQAAMFVSVGLDGDRVWAYYLDGSYLVQIQLSWGPDRELDRAVLAGETDLAEFATFGFTPIDIAKWVKDTYLPQIHENISNKIAEG